MKTPYRIEIVEQQDGWWVGEIWSADNAMVYRAHAKSKEVAQSQATTELGKYFGGSMKAEVTVKPLGST